MGKNKMGKSKIYTIDDIDNFVNRENEIIYTIYEFVTGDITKTDFYNDFSKFSKNNIINSLKEYSYLYYSIIDGGDDGDIDLLETDFFTPEEINDVVKKYFLKFKI